MMVHELLILVLLNMMAHGHELLILVLFVQKTHVRKNKKKPTLVLEKKIILTRPLCKEN